MPRFTFGSFRSERVSEKNLSASVLVTSNPRVAIVPGRTGVRPGGGCFILVDGDGYGTGMAQRAGCAGNHYGGLSRCGSCRFVGVAATASQGEQ
jgi:hypothetical protein